MKTAYHGTTARFDNLKSDSYVTNDPQIARAYGIQNAIDNGMTFQDAAKLVTIYKVEGSFDWKQAAPDEGEFLIAVTNEELEVR